MKFSVIVPVYNVEKYLSKCLDSIVNQTYQEFEVLVVNDGTEDNSQLIIDEYVKKYPDKIRSFVKENGGLSDARNYGVQHAKGDYIVYVDSDDFIGEKLLEKLNNEIEKVHDVDVIGYNFVSVDKDYNEIEKIRKPTFSDLNGEQAITKIILSKTFFEPAWGFAYNKKYWNENGFRYAKGLYHEDLGLTPIVIAKASKVSCIDYDGYYYYQSDNSIIRNCSIEKEKKKADDLLIHFDYLTAEIEKIDISVKAKKLIYAYLANTLIYKANNLSNILKKDYKKELEKRKIQRYIIDDTIKRKIRKLLIELQLKLM